MKPRYVTTRHYDAGGIGMGRILRIVLLWKVLGLSGLGRSQSPLVLVKLALYQRFGRHLSVITVKHERRWMQFLRGFRQRRAVIARRAGLIRDKLLGRL